MQSPGSAYWRTRSGRRPGLGRHAVGRRELRGTEPDEAGEEARTGDPPEAAVGHDPGEHDRASRQRDEQVARREGRLGDAGFDEGQHKRHDKPAEDEELAADLGGRAVTDKAGGENQSAATKRRRRDGEEHPRRGEVEVRLEARRGQRDEDRAERPVVRPRHPEELTRATGHREDRERRAQGGGDDGAATRGGPVCGGRRAR